MSDLSEIVHYRDARFSPRYTRALLDELMHVGDPAADAATAALSEEAYDPDGSQLQNLRALARDGEPRAVEFFLRAEHRPAWFDLAKIERGQKLALAFAQHYGLSLTHSLFSGAIFGRATLVTNSTGRLGSNPGRRIQETGAFLAALFEPGGLEPGALGFETAVRVRLLHGSIRSWIKRSPGFADSYVGEPLDQTMLAMTLGLFDYLNMRSMLRLGVPLSEEDLAAHHHLWRYVGYLIGIDERLLTEDLEQEKELWSALVAHQAFPELFGETYLDTVVDVVGQLSGAGDIGRGVIRSVFLHLSGEEWFGLEESFWPDPRVETIRWLSFWIGAAHRWLPFVADFMADAGSAQLSSAKRLAENHGFGVKLELDENEEEREAMSRTLAAGVQARFNGASAKYGGGAAGPEGLSGHVQ